LISQVGDNREKLAERMRERTQKTAEEGGEASAGFTYAESFKHFKF
jgi:hypothetical protein